VSLVAIQVTISTPLTCPDPLANDHVAIRRAWYEIPRLVGKKSRVLLFHRATPMRIRQGVTDGGGYRRDALVSRSGREGRGPKNASRPPRHHGMNMSRIPMEDVRVVHRWLGVRASRSTVRRLRWSCRWGRLRWTALVDAHRSRVPRGNHRERSRRSWIRRRGRHHTALVDPHGLGVPRGRCRR